MKTLKDFESIAALLSEREIDELLTAIDARREARAGRDDPSRAGRRPTQAGPSGPGEPPGERRAG